MGEMGGRAKTNTSLMSVPSPTLIQLSPRPCKACHACTAVTWSHRDKAHVVDYLEALERPP